MSRRVHVVFTGGTIGSVRLTGETAPGIPPVRQLLTTADAELEFTSSEPFQILSEDADPSHWTELARHIASLDLARLDAVIVTHGSDTLDWTAAALSYALLGIGIPVVLVGSDLPLEDPQANGAANFRDALGFALSEKLPGVFVAWKNPNEPTTIHLGTRLLSCDGYDNRFRSAADLAFGTVLDATFRRHAVPGNPSRSHLAKPLGPTWQASREQALQGVAFAPNLLVIPAQPGTDYRQFDPTNYAAVLQLAYHSGTAPSSEGAASLLAFAARCAQSKTPLLLGPSARREPYASLTRLEAAGVQRAPLLTPAALVTKLRWLLGRNADLSDLHTPMAFDLLPQGPM